jgi:hypothetical protein
MLNRFLAILLAPWLPLAAFIFPLSTPHRVAALVGGTLVTVLAAFALSSDRARFGAAAVAACVALTALVFPSSLLEETISLSWGVSMLAWLMGPLSAPPAVTRTAAAAPAPLSHDGEHLPMAA